MPRDNMSSTVPEATTSQAHSNYTVSSSVEGLSVTLPPIVVLTNLIPVLLAPVILAPSSGGSALSTSGTLQGRREMG